MEMMKTYNLERRLEFELVGNGNRWKDVYFLDFPSLEKNEKRRSWHYMCSHLKFFRWRRNFVILDYRL